MWSSLALIQAPAALLSKESATSGPAQSRMTLVSPCFYCSAGGQKDVYGWAPSKKEKKTLTVVVHRAWMWSLCCGSLPSASKETRQLPKTCLCPASFVPQLASEWLCRPCKRFTVSGLLVEINQNLRYSEIQPLYQTPTPLHTFPISACIHTHAQQHNGIQRWLIPRLRLCKEALNLNWSTAGIHFVYTHSTTSTLESIHPHPPSCVPGGTARGSKQRKGFVQTRSRLSGYQWPGFDFGSSRNASAEGYDCMFWHKIHLVRASRRSNWELKSEIMSLPCTVAT